MARFCWTLVTFICFAAAQCAHGATKPMRVLFVGNSLTYFNALPSMVVAVVAKSHTPISIEVEMLAAPGVSIRQNLDAGQLARVLGSGNFNAVVLQEIGGFPLCSEDFPGCKDTLRSLEEAAETVRRSGARAILLATYTDRDSQGALSVASQTVAETLKTSFFDWGDAIVNAGKRDPSLVLVGRDRHPTEAGSWLAAIGIAQLLTDAPTALRPERVCAPDWTHAKLPLSNSRLASRQSPPAVNCFELADSTYSNLKFAATQTLEKVRP